MTGKIKDRFRTSLIFSLIFMMCIGTSFVHCFSNDNLSQKMEINKMILEPFIRYEKYSIVGGSSVTFYYQSRTVYYNHFFNFTVPNYSNGSIIIESEQVDNFNPSFLTGELGIGETFVENCTFVGSFTQGDKIDYYEIKFTLGTGTNTTIIFTHIIWDFYVYKMGIGGIIGFSIAGIAIIVLIIFLVKPKRKEYANV